MLYIQQSLNPNEEIVRIGHFHWWYTFNAALNIVFGIIGMVGILYVGYYYEVYQTIKEFVPETSIIAPNADGYWDPAVQHKGGIIATIQSIHIAIKLGAFLSVMFGLLIFAQKMIIKATTEICLTSDRLVLKRGLVSRHVAEMNIDRIEGVDVFQGILGRILGFGFVAVRGMGIGEVALPAIADPIEFRKAIERARSIRRTGEI